MKEIQTALDMQIEARAKIDESIKILEKALEKKKEKTINVPVRNSNMYDVTDEFNLI